jgi:hypothetical protein
MSLNINSLQSARLGYTRRAATLAATWDKGRIEERRVPLDWWILDVLIVVEPIPGMKRANHETALVTPRTAPDAPRHFPIGHQLSSED